MTTPPSAVANTNDPFAGGFYGRAALPTGVNGAIAFPGTPASRPPDVQPSNILSARTDRQTNEKLPYARVSQIVRSDAAKRRIETSDGREDFVTPDKNLTSGVLGFTYSPVEKGGKHDDSNRDAYKSSLAGFGTKTKYDGPLPTFNADGAPLPGLAVLPNNSLAPKRGFNQERMQLMAAVDWVESFVLSRFVDVGKKIDLLNVRCTDNKGLAKMFEDALKWSPNVLRVPDIAGIYGTTTALNVQGLFVMEEGPFLRSYNAENHEPIDIAVPGYPPYKGGAAYLADGTDTVDRHVGSQIAHDALYRELERTGVLDWKPDGIVLSRLATGPDQEQDDVFDLQNGALINMAISGPAITSSWTNKPKMLCLPMDKVFVVVVADLSYKVDAPSGRLAKAIEACDTLKDSVEKGDSDAYKTTYADDLSGTAYGNAKAIQDPTKDSAAREAAMKTLKDRVDALNAANVLGTASSTELSAWLEAQLALRSGKSMCTHATLSSFRLMRVTSSFLTNTSRFVPGNPESRCGLKIGATISGSTVTGASETILGGWCIGTVMDAAASRAAIGLNRVHSARSTMAMSVNVNVAWWSADDLYAHYMDKTMAPPGKTTITSYKTPDSSIASRPSGVKSVDEPPPKVLGIHADQDGSGAVDGITIANVDAPAAGARGAVSAAVAPAAGARPAAGATAARSRPTRPL